MAGDPQLFAPLDIRGLTLANRIVFGPMATYSAVAGTVGDWHLAHLSRFATGGSALIFLEAAAICARTTCSRAPWASGRTNRWARFAG